MQGWAAWFYVTRWQDVTKTTRQNYLDQARPEGTGALYAYIHQYVKLTSKVQHDSRHQDGGSETAADPHFMGLSAASSSAGRAYYYSPVFKDQAQQLPSSWQHNIQLHDHALERLGCISTHIVTISFALDSIALVASSEISDAVQSASTASAPVEKEENGLRLRHNNQSSQSRPSAEPSAPDTEEGNLNDAMNSTPASTERADGESIEPYLSFLVLIYHVMLHLTAIAALYLGTDTVAHTSGAFFMVFLIYVSSKLSNLEARSHAPLSRIGLSIPLASVLVLWFLLHALFAYTSTQGFSPLVKACPFGLRFLIMALYFFTLRHKSLVVGGSQPPGTECHIENDFRLYFAGSGGHTGELLQMLTNSPPTDNIHRIWVICHGDETSRQKICDWEAKRKSGKSLVSGYEIVPIRRARRVHQHWATVPVSAIQCAYDIYKVLNQGYPYRGAQSSIKEPGSDHMPGKGYPQVIVTNGPGTGLIIAGVAWLMKLLWCLPANSCKVLFIESIARVKTLSLTGKLFYYTGIATDIVVQHTAVGETYDLRVEEMLTARELSDPGGKLFPGSSGIH
ncbi:UDP-N-acetylglucosamine transferase subunit ALG14 [Apiospora phragmitis]|uniref:UDP-N-acetylglucosamine transferase subunit ALG14 n=1 Tax=Apiospora phragmitis TaxID=2905665 RepID=A0ABR1WU02_9PEZI